MNFESMNDEMFKSYSDEKSRSMRGGYTRLLTDCSSTLFGLDESCGDSAKDEIVVIEQIA